MKQKLQETMSQIIREHKMQEFETTNITRVGADLELDEYANSLSADKAEQLSANIQQKMDELIEELDAKYHSRKQSLNEQGVFHSSVNALRAEAMCLVDVQRR